MTLTLLPLYSAYSSSTKTATHEQKEPKFGTQRPRNEFDRSDGFRWNFHHSSQDQSHPERARQEKASETFRREERQCTPNSERANLSRKEPIQGLSQENFDKLMPIKQVQYLTSKDRLPKAVMQNKDKTNLSFVYEDDKKYNLDLGVSSVIILYGAWDTIKNKGLLPEKYLSRKPTAVVDFFPVMTTIGTRTIIEKLPVVVGYKLDL